MVGDRTRTVVDVGSATHGGDVSIGPLIERFAPRVLYGFDPQQPSGREMISGTEVILEPWVAWTAAGTVGFSGEGLGARVGEGVATQCFDLPAFLCTLDPPVVLKLDCEGSEYELIPALIDTRVDVTLELLLVEWHCPECGHGAWSHRADCDSMPETEELASSLERQLACPVERWAL